MVGSLMHGLSTNARRATGPGTAQYSNAEMFATSVPLSSTHYSPTIPLGFKRRLSISKHSGGSRRKELLHEVADWEHLEIELSVPFPSSMRLDRLLALELRISRSQLSALHRSALLRTTPDRTDLLRRRIRNGIRVTLDLSGMADRDLVWKPAAIENTS